MKKKLKRGFTLVELMIVVAIVGVLAALAIYGVRKYIANAKTAEARNSLGQISKDASSAYAREGMAGTVLTLGSVANISNKLCAKATSPVPATKGSIQGQKYQSSPAEWAYDQKTAGKGFACLKFSVSGPQHFLYRYKTSTTNVANAGKVNATFDAVAQGDLDGDGVLSEIKLSGKIVQAGKGSVLVVAPAITETNPEE